MLKRYPINQKNNKMKKELWTSFLFENEGQELSAIYKGSSEIAECKFRAEFPDADVWDAAEFWETQPLKEGIFESPEPEVLKPELHRFRFKMYITTSMGQKFIIGYIDIEAKTAEDAIDKFKKKELPFHSHSECTQIG